ncbi:MAG: hypothetical protein Q7U04_10555 [Bacteriovorax sp.]|nr:hypothetical protein [Bacteriovorax sp.]
MKTTIFFIIVFIIVSCSTSSKKEADYSHLGDLTERDYIDHLASIGADYISNQETHEIRLTQESQSFLTQIYDRIISNNELLFVKGEQPSFHIVINKTPFIFSLPRAQFFISSGLIEKYLKSEELFVAALSAEIVKSNRNIYEKKIMIPLGFYSTEKMILLTRLKPETKYQVNEWTYIVLKRAGLDPTAFLNWIQVQNRNTLDFSLYLGDAIGISKEEHSFKNFMTKQGLIGTEKKTLEANSSKLFYKLINNISSKK